MLQLQHFHCTCQFEDVILVTLNEDARHREVAVSCLNAICDETAVTPEFFAEVTFPCLLIQADAGVLKVFLFDVISFLFLP